MNNVDNFDRHRIEELISLTESFTDDFMYYWDFMEDFYYISEAASRIFEVPAGGFNNVTNILKKVIYQEDFHLVDKDIDNILNRGQMEHNLEYRWVSKKGELIWISCRGKVIRDNEGKASCLIGRVTQLGSRQKADNLTGFLREDILEARFNDMIAAKKTGYIMKIGIDNLKNINEKYGMNMGDEVIKYTANCLRSMEDEYNVEFFRMQGDELAVFNFSGGTNEQAFEMYNKLKRSVEGFAKDTDYKIFFMISAGVVEYPNQAEIYSDMQRYVEFALNSAKRHGRNSIEIFSKKNYEKHIEEIDLQEKLRKDVANGCKNFSIYYQPVMDISKNELSGAEALLRWKDESTGCFVPPYKFVPLLEESALIIPVGKMVLIDACKRCVEWRKIIPKFKINVNVSYVQINGSDIFNDVWQCINDAGLNEDAIVLELTESGYIDTDETIKSIMGRFHEKNIKVALDDFGTGYSNLRYLKELQFDVLKIDRSFVCKALEEDYNYELIRNIISMAHSINLKVCLEGVETDNELKALSSLLPDYIQGYYFGKPVSADDFFKENIAQNLSI